MSAAVIHTEALAKDFGGGKGLLALDLEVFEGEIMGFLGPNGAGKTTAMRTLLNLLQPTGGSAQVLGHDCVAESLAIRRRVGFLPGDLELYGELTGEEMLDYLAALRGGVDRRLRNELCERFGAQLERPVRDLSTGNRQKIGLVQAFMHEPELLILDEPIAGLDPLVQQSFHGLLAEVRAEGRTVFLSSHTLSEVERVADRVAILRDGRLVALDPLSNLLAVAIQHLEVEFAAATAPDRFRELPGVREAMADGTRMRISFSGSADPIVKALAECEVVAIRTRSEDLEEVFLHFYRGSGDA